MMKITKLGAFKNYDIRITLKENNDDIQMLVFLNDELAYATKKGSFKTKKCTIEYIKFNKLIPRCVSEERTKLVWNNDKERSRYINFCKKFKYSTCVKLQEESMAILSNINNVLTTIS